MSLKERGIALVVRGAEAFAAAMRAADAQAEDTQRTLAQSSAAIERSFSTVSDRVETEARAIAASLQGASTSIEQELTDASRSVGRSTDDIATAVQRATDAIAREGQAIDGALAPAERALRDIATTAAQEARATENALDGIAQEAASIDAPISKSALAFAAIGTAAAAAAAVAAAALAGILTQVAELNSGLGNASRSLKVQFGLTAEEAEGLSKTALDLYAKNVGESFEDVVTVLAETKRQLKGITDSELGVTVTDAIAIRDAFGQDITKVLNATNVLMDKFGLNSEQAFNVLTTGFQRGLDTSGDFLDSVSEYGISFANAGFSAEQLLSALSEGLQGGVLGTDKISDAFKEFGILLQELDGDALAVSSSLSAIGFSTEEIASIQQGLADGTLSIVDAYELITPQLLATEDGLVRNQAGVALLGSFWEDMQASSFEALDLSTIKLRETEGSVAGLQDQYGGMSNAIEGAMRKVEVALLPLAERLLPYVTDAIISLAQTLETYLTPENIEAFVATASEAFTDFMYGVRTISAGIAVIMDAVHIALTTQQGLVRSTMLAINGDFEAAGQQLQDTSVNFSERTAQLFQEKFGVELPLIGRQAADDTALGVVEGLHAGEESVGAAAAALAGRLAGSIEDELEIRSPSKRAGRIAKDGVGEGLIGGLVSIMLPAEDAAASVGKAIATGIGSGISENMRATQETLLLEMQSLQRRADDYLMFTHDDGSQSERKITKTEIAERRRQGRVLERLKDGSSTFIFDQDVLDEENKKIADARAREEARQKAEEERREAARQRERDRIQQAEERERRRLEDAEKQQALLRREAQQKEQDKLIKAEKEQRLKQEELTRIAEEEQRLKQEELTRIAEEEARDRERRPTMCGGNDDAVYAFSLANVLSQLNTAPAHQTYAAPVPAQQTFVPNPNTYSSWITNDNSNRNVNIYGGNVGYQSLVETVEQQLNATSRNVALRG